MMQSSLSQNNAGGSVEASPPIFKTLRLLSGRYLHMFWSGSVATHEDEMDDDITAAGDERKYNDNCSVGGETLEIISVPQGSGETPSDIRSKQDSASEGETPSGIRSRQDSDIDASEGEAAFQRSQSPVTAALAALARHCPPQLGRKTKTTRFYSSLEQEDSPKIARKRRQLTGLGRPRQDDVLLAWLTHALAPSDVRSDGHAQDQKNDEDPCNSKVGNTSPKSVSHASVKRRGTAHKISLTSIQEGRRSYWLTRPLRTTRTFDTSAQGDLQPPTSPPDNSQTPPIPAVQFPSAYPSCFANPQRQPSVIRWKLP
ncbi:uncharacterized protein F5147DRAFT_421211 [Suillus discolor]|uniref:Uncharacterized protein n=1 Tax=Suillus discolor TaxID=1912936 RepID=A0A9P7EWU4_9AGAM|nr:uncharacterized protein F5147DRAFT_421211 [Suillus discolor]KAG2093510.1 hypothetical protein F5147DRAFT_421211 [Suillus discolor]